MRTVFSWAAAGVVATAALIAAQAAGRPNPTIDLLSRKQPVFGLYAPGPGRGTPQKSAADLAKEAAAYDRGDLLFSGAMEGNFERGYGPFAEFVGELAKPGMRARPPLATKIPKIGADAAQAVSNISRQLNLGVSTVVFVDVESAAEVQRGLAAMRFASKGGTRPEIVGSAPAYWGVSEAVYREKADLWPLNPSGELVNWTIVESREGLAKVREIAAVKGIGVLFPGAGTLRRVFTTVNQEGERVFDEAGWEGAIQQVLAACKEFDVACGYPATEKDIELRMKQGFSVFIINWGDAGFRAVEIGRKAGGR